MSAMSVVPERVRVWRGGVVERMARCMSVSVFTTTLSLSALAVMTAGLGVTAWLANVGATALGTVPSYHLNRKWVWGRRDTSDPWREVLPFWVLSFSGLVLSTIAVAVTDAWAAASHLASDVRTPLVLSANVAAFAALWLVQFVLLDRVLFARRKELP